MRVRVIELFEEGKQVPRWQLSLLKVTEGELAMVEFRDEVLNRHMRAAHLHQVDGPMNKREMDILTPLLDAAVLWIRDQRMTITGFQREVLGKTTAQTWLIEIVTQTPPALATPYTA